MQSREVLVDFLDGLYRKDEDMEEQKQKQKQLLWLQSYLARIKEEQDDFDLMNFDQSFLYPEEAMMWDTQDESEDKSEESNDGDKVKINTKDYQI